MIFVSCTIKSRGLSSPQPRLNRLAIFLSRTTLVWKSFCCVWFKAVSFWFIRRQYFGCWQENTILKMGVIERASREIQISTNAGQVIAGQEWKSASPTKNVLLLHGWQDNSNSFKKLANLLPADWHLVAIDFPGHGVSSPRPDGVPYYVTDWVSDVRLVIQRKRNPSIFHWKHVSQMIGEVLVAMKINRSGVEEVYDNWTQYGSWSCFDGT